MPENKKTDRFSEITLYLIRHATPDWYRKDIPYNVPPGPPLTEFGKSQAKKLGDVLTKYHIQRLYASPMERAFTTAQIAAQMAHIPIEKRNELLEWQPDESEEDLAGRMRPFLNECINAFQTTGPVGLVSHGGPITVLLKMLNMDSEKLENSCHSFDGNNPLPPAGVWKVSRLESTEDWDFNLLYTPDLDKIPEKNKKTNLNLGQ